MDDFVIKLISDASYAGLFIWLLYYTMSNNSKREEKYQNTINKNQEIIAEMAKKLSVVDDIQADVKEIKETLER